jgi:hypothetical protein
MGELRFWTEQYLLQAFPNFYSEFEVLLANSYLAYRYLADFKSTFPNSPWWADTRTGLPRGGDISGCADVHQGAINQDYPKILA